MSNWASKKYLFDDSRGYTSVNFASTTDATF